MNCEYCGMRNEASISHCKYCGAEMRKTQVADNSERKNGPIFYNGYIVYVLSRGWDFQNQTYQFWLGVNLIESIEINREFMMDFVGEFEDPMPFVWKLFELAQGREEVLKYKERNKEFPATFEVRRVENKELTEQKARLRELIG